MPRSQPKGKTGEPTQPQGTSPTRRQFRGPALRLLATVGLLAVGAWVIDLDAVGQELANLQASWLLAALALSIPLHASMAWRWWFTARRTSTPLTYREAVSDCYAASALNHLVPVALAGETWRVVRHARRVSGRRSRSGLGAALRAVLLERLSGLLALAPFLLAAAGLWASRGQSSEADGIASGVTALLTGLVVLAALLLLLLLVLLAVGALDRSAEPRWAAHLRRDARRALVSRGAAAVQLALSSACILLLVGMFYCIARAAGSKLEALDALQIVPLVLGVTSLPLVFAGWGVREVSTASLFAAAGLDPAAGTALSIVFGLVSTVGALPGLLVLMARPRRDKSTSRPALPMLHTPALDAAQEPRLAAAHGPERGSTLGAAHPSTLTAAHGPALGAAHGPERGPTLGEAHLSTLAAARGPALGAAHGPERASAFDPNSAAFSAFILAALLGAAIAGAAHWFAAAGLAAFAFRLERAGRPWATVSRGFGVANGVTTVRIVLTTGLGFFALQLGSLAAVSTAVLILALDGVDGWIARRTGTSSGFGAWYDMEADGYFVAVLCLLLHQLDQAGPWVVVAGGLRYAYAIVIALYAPRANLPRSRLGRAVFFILVVSLLAAMTFEPPWSSVLAALGTVAVTVSFAHSFSWVIRMRRVDRMRSTLDEPATAPP